MGLIEPSGQHSLNANNVQTFINRIKKPKILKILAATMAVFLIAGGTFYFLNNHKSGNKVASKPIPCSFFTLEDAKILLGKNTTKGGIAPMSQVPSKDFTAENCTYSQNAQGAGGNIGSQSIKTASVVVRAPKTSLANTFVDFLFVQGKPKNSEDLSGYGEKAYWDPVQGILYSKKGNKFITIIYGVPSPATSRTLGETKKLADLVIPKL
jgi:hypothetical protein